MLRRVGVLVGGLVLVLAACGGDGDADTTAPATEAPTTTAATTTAAPTTEAPTTTAATTTVAPTTEAPAATEVSVSSSTLGEILTDQDGYTLYLFLPDGQGPSVCDGDCALAWPPLGEAAAGAGIDAALLGTAARSDGSAQATYNGWPLYYFAADGAPGDVNGQGVNDVWFVIDADGNGVAIP